MHILSEILDNFNLKTFHNIRRNIQNIIVIYDMFTPTCYYLSDNGLEHVLNS